MTVSKRDTILTGIKTTLAGISVANGYNLTVKSIHDVLKATSDLTQDQFPALIVIDADESKDDGDVDEMKNRLNVIVTGYVFNPEQDYDLQADLRKLLADVEKCLCADRFRAALAYNTRPSSIKTDGGLLRPYAIFDFTFQIEYLQLYGVP